MDIREREPGDEVADQGEGEWWLARTKGDWPAIEFLNTTEMQ